MKNLNGETITRQAREMLVTGGAVLVDNTITGQAREMLVIGDVVPVDNTITRQVGGEA